jgi:hypothetical protein
MISRLFLDDGILGSSSEFAFLMKKIVANPPTYNGGMAVSSF